MARTFNMNIQIQGIRWESWQGGNGAIQPYLWTAFFKIDGTTVIIDRVLGTLVLAGLNEPR